MTRYANPRSHNPRGTPEQIAAVRALYEGTPGATADSIAEATGVPAGTIRRWKAAQQWTRPARVVKEMPNLSARVADATDRIKVKMTELGKPLSDETALAEAARATAEEFAVDVRAQVLDRHRKEWSAPRKIAYEAIQGQDFEKAKLAKITSETLTLIQAGECRAYGINHDARAGDGAGVVIIDRTNAEDAG